MPDTDATRSLTPDRFGETGPALLGSVSVRGPRRRVLHLECAALALPPPLRWREEITLGSTDPEAP